MVYDALLKNRLRPCFFVAQISVLILISCSVATKPILVMMTVELDAVWINHCAKAIHRTGSHSLWSRDCLH